MIRRVILGFVLVSAALTALVAGTSGVAARKAYACCGNSACDTLRASMPCTGAADCRDVECPDGTPCATCCDDACASR